MVCTLMHFTKSTAERPPRLRGQPQLGGRDAAGRVVAKRLRAPGPEKDGAGRMDPFQEAPDIFRKAEVFRREAI